MSTTLQRPPGAVERHPGEPSAADVAAAVWIADRTLHASALLLRGGIYLGLGIAADRFAFGPHLLAGVLVGDFAGYVLSALRSFRRSPVAAAAELALFALLFAFWWWRYALPEAPEFQALFCLGGFGALTGRIGIAAAARDRDGWD
jgi:hypothetical protein